MLPPSRMLATKNQAGKERQCLFLALAVFLAGCSPPGNRALLDGKRLLESGKNPEAVEKLSFAASSLATNAHAWNYLGLAHHRAGQPTNAVAAYHKAILLDRDLLEARYNLGCLWLEENQLDAAKTEFTAYTLRRGNEVEGWLKLATAQLRGRETVAAEKSFQEARRINPKNVEAFNGLGLAQLQRNRPQEAVQFFSAALKQQPDYRPALLNLATVLQQQLNDRAGALQKYRDYLALKPKSDDWNEVNAVALALEQQLSPPAVRTPPTNNVPKVLPGPNPNIPQGSTATKLATPAKSNLPPALVKPATPVPTPPQAKPSVPDVVKLPAEPVIKPAANVPVIVAEPTLPTTKSNLPVRAGDPPAPPKPGFLARLNPFRRDESSSPATTKPAVEEKKKVPTKSAPPANVVEPSPAAGPSRYAYRSPSMPAAGNRRAAERAFWQGQQAQRANRASEAAAAYQQAIQADPSFFEAHYNFALLAYEARSYRQALTAWEYALAIRPDSADVRYNFALTLKAASHPQDAANELGKVIAANPREARAHLVLGNLCAESLNDKPRARRHYQKVLELDPRHPQAAAIRYWLVANP